MRMSLENVTGRASTQLLSGRAVAGGILLFLLMGTAGMRVAAAQAQSDSTAEAYTISFRNVPLDDALLRLSRKTKVDLAYPSGLVENRYASCRTRSIDPEELLSCVLAGTGVDYVRSSGETYVLFEELRQSPQYGRISGTVVDGATGEPLPRANVLLADASTGTTTSSSGRFQFGRVLSGVHRIIVTYVGYATQIDSLIVPPDDRKQIRIALDSRPISTEPLIVDGLQQRLPSGSLGKATVEADPLKEISAQGTPDVLRAAGSQPGVSASRPLAELHVQGGSTGEHVLHLDGVPVRDPVSLGGFFGAFSPLAIDRLTVHKAGFGAKHGSYTAGVLSATHDVSSSDDRFEVTVDPISTNGRANVQWETGSGQSGGAMVAGRSSIWPLYQSRALNRLLETWTTPDPTLTPLWLSTPTGPISVGRQRHQTETYFSDLHAAVRQPIGSFHELYVSAYRADNRLSASLASALTGDDGPILLEARDEYVWGNTAVQGRHTWVASSQLTASFQLYGSWHDSQYDYRIQDAPLGDDSLRLGSSTLRLSEAPRETNTVAEGGLKAMFDYSPHSDVQIEASLSGKHIDGAFRLQNRFTGPAEYSTSAWQWSGHFGTTVSLSLQTTLEGGLRLTHLPTHGNAYAEPRLSIRYDQPDGPLGAFAVRVAGGLYRQYITQEKISSAQPTSVIPSLRFWLPLDKSVAPPRAYHGSASVLLMPNPAWSMRVEGYYKRHLRLHHVDYPNLINNAASGRMRGTARSLAQQSAFLGNGQGRSYGINAILQRKRGRITGELTAGWSTANRRYERRFGERWVAAPWEEPVRLSAQLNARIVDGVRLRTRWESVWGRSWSLRRIYYDYVGPSGATPTSDRSFDTPSKDRLTPYHRFDVGLKGKQTWSGVTATAELRLVNVLDRSNPFDVSLRPKGASFVQQPRRLPGRRFVAVLALRY